MVSVNLIRVYSVPLLLYLSTYYIYVWSTRYFLTSIITYFTSLIIVHKTYLNKHDNTFVSTLSLIFTRQSHIILSGYDSQETLFYLKAMLTFIDESTDLRD